MENDSNKIMLQLWSCESNKLLLMNIIIIMIVFIIIIVNIIIIAVNPI